MLEEYLVQSSKQYGLTHKQVRDLAYSYAVKLQRKFPNRWETEKTAGLDWMKGFMKRHQRLSLRKPENTSIARNLNFNQHNVLFFNNLEMVKGKHNFPPDMIINIDESGLTTVLEAPKEIAPTGVTQIGQTVSAERGEFVTICGIVSAAGIVYTSSVHLSKSAHEICFSGRCAKWQCWVFLSKWLDDARSFLRSDKTCCSA